MLHIVEKEDVSDQVKAVFSDEFFNKLNCDNPPDILWKSRHEMAEWGGYCSHIEYTQNGEIVLDSFYLQRPSSVKSTYIHEMAHRLMPQSHKHSAQFFCLNYTLQAGRVRNKLQVIRYSGFR